VVLDPGNVIVSIFLPLPGLGGIKSAFGRISGWIIESLAKVGIPGVEQRGVSDLVLGDRKIGGSCIWRGKDLLHYGTTILVEPDLDRVARYLKHPPREPDYRMGRPHGDFMGSLGLLCGVDDAGRFAEELGSALVIPDTAKHRGRKIAHEISCSRS
jgi:lipoate-protein ligase A